MCVVSNIGDSWRTGLPSRWPNVDPLIPRIPTRDLESLKKEIEELRLLLLAAKKFDNETGQAKCETEDKVALIKRLAEALGVDMSDVFE